MKRILVIGGAGYIGSAITRLLCDAGYTVHVLDNLSRGSLRYVDERARFTKGDILDAAFLTEYFFSLGGGGDVGLPLDGIIHMAAHKDVGGSSSERERFAENVTGTENVLKAVSACWRKLPVGMEPCFVFSSTASVYGEPGMEPITEETPLRPTNYYGKTKVLGEELVQKYAAGAGFNYVNLRYFNVVGDIGLHYEEREATNLFPVIHRVLSGRQDALTIFGDNYPTPDGTAIRDYVHLADLAEAHVLALEWKNSGVLNLSTGQGYSVKEVVEEFERSTGRKLPVRIGPRRGGDPAFIVASAAKAERELGWDAERGLSEMVLI